MSDYRAGYDDGCVDRDAIWAQVLNKHLGFPDDRLDWTPAAFVEWIRTNPPAKETPNGS